MNLSTRLLAVSTFAAISAFSLNAQTPSGGARIAARALGETPMLSDLQEMCDRIGGRPTGSPACERAVDWAAAKLKAAGLDVRTESFTVPGLWLAESAEGAVLGAD